MSGLIRKLSGFPENSNIDFRANEMYVRIRFAGILFERTNKGRAPSLWGIIYSHHESVCTCIGRMQSLWPRFGAQTSVHKYEWIIYSVCPTSKYMISISHACHKSYISEYTVYPNEQIARVEKLIKWDCIAKFCREMNRFILEPFFDQFHQNSVFCG